MDDLEDGPEDLLEDNDDDEVFAPPEEVDTISDLAATEDLVLLKD